MRKARAFLWPLLLAAAYRIWFIFRDLLTGFNQIDGLIGVGIGLYICARGSANLLDMLLAFRSSSLHYTRRSTELWVTFNFLMLFIGFFLLVFALTRFFR